MLRNAAGVIPNAARVYFNDDNSLYTGAAIFDGVSPAGPGSTAGLYRYNGPFRIGDFQFRKIDSTGELEEFIPGHKANVPLERYSVFARANYDITDNLTAHVQTQSVEVGGHAALAGVAGDWRLEPHHPPRHGRLCPVAGGRRHHNAAGLPAGWPVRSELSRRPAAARTRKRSP